MSEVPLRIGHATPSGFVQLAVRMYGTLSGKRIKDHPQLGIRMAKAGMPLVPSAYLAAAYLRVTIAAVFGLVLLIIYLAASGGIAQANPSLVAALVAAPIVFGVISYSYDLLRPDLMIASRARNLEGNLPYALNFLAALASAGVVPDEIFGALSKQPIYGQVAHESGLIYRDTKLFSKDLVQALREASRRSPSRQFEEFLSGAVNTVTSGGDMTKYLMAKSEHFAHENHRKQKAFLESMGVMAEAYVVVGAAAPLFLIVILSVMLLLSEGGDPTFYLNLIVLLAMPVIHGAFTWVLRNMRPE